MYRKWAAIVAIGACLERRVWTITAKGPTFPNLFVILIGRPGIGKSEAINGVRALVASTKIEGLVDSACHLAPVDVTKASLYDYLSKAKIRKTGPDPEAEALGVDQGFHYHSAFLAVTELSDLIRDHDTALLGALHGLYDCLPFIEEERRYRADNPIKIPRPQISLLGGTTPAYISRTFPPSAWDEGFMARSILIYSSDMIEPDLFGSEEEVTDPYIARELVEDLRQIGTMVGRMQFSDDCKSAMKQWQRSGREPKPTHNRLEHYCTRRMRHAIKLSIIASADRGNDLVVTAEDFQQALAWMIEAEEAMPQIFMEMVGKSDGQVMAELAHFVRAQFESVMPGLKAQPVRRGLLVNFLRNKVPSYQIDKIIETACEAEMIQKAMMPNTEIRYKPVAKKRPN